MSNKTASARKNGSFGYKAVVNYVEGYSKIPVRQNFKTREDAVAYAQKWIDANDSRPVGVRAKKFDVRNSLIEVEKACNLLPNHESYQLQRQFILKLLLRYQIKEFDFNN